MRTVHVLKVKWFGRFARHEKITDRSLLEAIERAERGLIDADLGFGLIKQRVARKGSGRSGGYRVIVAYREGDRAIFLYGFAKSELADIPPRSLETFRTVARTILNLSEEELAVEVEEGRLQEVPQYGDEDEKERA